MSVSVAVVLRAKHTLRRPALTRTLHVSLASWSEHHPNPTEDPTQTVLELNAPTPTDEPRSAAAAAAAATRQTNAVRVRQIHTCYMCGKKGHRQRECPERPPDGQTKCVNCGTLGHMSMECTAPPRKKRTPLVVEPSVATTSHEQMRALASSSDEPDVQSVEKPRASKDRRIIPLLNKDRPAAHELDSAQSTETPEKPRPRPRRICDLCGKEGHTLSKCPDRAPECFNCGELGHLSKQCTASRKIRAIRICPACGKPGHIREHCPGDHVKPPIWMKYKLRSKAKTAELEHAKWRAQSEFGAVLTPTPNLNTDTDTKS